MSDEPITQRDLQSAVATAALAVQMTEVIKDLGALNTRMDAHEKRHDRETAQAASNRRWLVGTGVAFLLAIEAPIGYLIVHLR